MPRNLNTLLREAYGHRQASSVKNGATTIRIDDENADDRYDGFCRIWVNVPDTSDDAFTLELQNAPHNSDVTALVKGVGGEINESPLVATTKIPLQADDAPFVLKLAKAIRRTTARGQRYPDPNWKWISRRTADALERFAAVLVTARRAMRRAVV